MRPFLGRFTEPIYSLFRFAAGFLFLQHGAQKLFGWFGKGPNHEPLMLVAGTIEFFGGILIMLGLLTPLVAFIASGQMAAAYFMVHAPQNLWPIMNAGSLAALYCFAFLYIAARGSGRWSLDALIWGRGRAGGS